MNIHDRLAEMGVKATMNKDWDDITLSFLPGAELPEVLPAFQAKLTLICEEMLNSKLWDVMNYDQNRQGTTAPDPVEPDASELGDIRGVESAGDGVEIPGDDRATAAAAERKRLERGWPGSAVYGRSEE